MSWETHIKSAENMLGSSRIPDSHEIITLIKRINPTTLLLSETDRERGYRLKNELQSLLLENYGETFLLASHPYSPDIMLIKHKTLQSIDACHADIKSLSVKALDAVVLAPAPVEKPAAKQDLNGKSKGKAPGCCSPKEALKVAQRLLDEYEYPQAEEHLSAIRIQESKDLPALIKAARILTEEMGAYDSAIVTLLSQPKHVLKDKGVRELLALTYYGNGMIPEARALLDSVHPADLGKHALYAYADISFKDGNFPLAFNLLQLSEQLEGFVTAHPGLRTEIEQCLLAQAEPWLQKAEAALARHEWAQAESLAREALAHYPNFPKARNLIETIKMEAEKAALWAQFACCQEGTKKLDLLARLLERDKRNREKIKHLIDAEKSKQDKERMDDRLRTLHMAAAQEMWSECFDILLCLSRPGNADEQLRQAFHLHPYFSVMYQNSKLLSLPEKTSKELWLCFVKVRSLLISGTTEGCWDLCQKLKPFFHSHPLFREDYERVSDMEKEKARSALRELLAELEAEECTLPQAKRIVARMRQTMAALPAEECSFYREAAAGRLDELEPEKTQLEIIEDYRRALYIGNAAKAASLREKINNRDAVIYMDAEVQFMFAMQAEPIPVTVSPDLRIDLVTERASLTWMGSFDCHVMFREDDATIVLVNVRRMTATRYRSPNFQDLVVLDCIPAKDTFLFRDTSNWSTMWRANFPGTEGHFTAMFELSDHFTFEPDASFEEIFMSSGKDNDYYACIKEGGTLRVVKESLDIISNTVRTYSVEGKAKYLYRLSYQPDGFVIGTDCGTTVLDNNLATPKGCSRVGCSIVPQLFAVDAGGSLIYSSSDGFVNVINTKLRAVKQYLHSLSAGYLDMYNVRGVCPATDTALVTLNPRKGFLYDLVTDQFSQQFSLSQILWTETPSSWYYFQYHQADSTITIKEITADLNGLLEWQTLYWPEEDDAANDASMKQLENIDFFRLPGKDGIDAEIE